MITKFNLNFKEELILIITQEEMSKIAKQVHLKIEDEKLPEITKDLDNVIKFTRQIFKVDISKLDHIIDDAPENVFREDEVKPFPDKELLLVNAPKRDVDCFLVPRIIN